VHDSRHSEVRHPRRAERLVPTPPSPPSSPMLTCRQLPWAPRRWRTGAVGLEAQKGPVTRW